MVERAKILWDGVQTVVLAVCWVGNSLLTWFPYLLGEDNILHMLLGCCEDLVCGVSKVLTLNKFSIIITSS